MSRWILMMVSVLVIAAAGLAGATTTQIYEDGVYYTTDVSTWLQWNNPTPVNVTFIGDTERNYDDQNSNPLYVCYYMLRFYYAPTGYVALQEVPVYNCGIHTPIHDTHTVYGKGSGSIFRGYSGWNYNSYRPIYPCDPLIYYERFVFIFNSEPTKTVSGTFDCVDNVTLYVDTNGAGYAELDADTSSPYSFTIYNNADYHLVFSDGAYHDFACDGSDVTFDYDACLWVYGYTCGVDTIKLYNDTGGWGLDDSVGQSTGYDVYEMPIIDGEDYKISFIDSTIDGDFVVHNQTFSCSGDHVLIDFDRCEWIYPISPPAQPYIIYLWTGYDYNIVVFKDAHGNFIENSQLAIYDKTDGQYIQRWTDASDGYALLGARFAADHDVILSLRTFDGIFTLDTTYPANGSAAVGEEDITTTNWTIPIKYNLNVLPVDQYGVSLFDVFCGLSEYTPLNPGAFWGMDLSDQGYVAVTNCSGFAMCDIIAEKDGYADYKVEALNWTSKSALVKDYRHNVVMEEE